MYKLIFIDYSMPLMDGPQTAVKIREALSERAGFKMNPFIICCTAYGEAMFKNQALASGMDAFVTKPLKHTELV